MSERSIIIMKKTLSQIKNKPRFIILICIILAVFTEIFLGNYRHWESLFFKPVSYEGIALGDGVTYISDQTYQLDFDKDASIYIVGLNDIVNNIYIGIDCKYKIMTPPAISVAACDEGNSVLTHFFSKSYYPSVEQTNYYRTHFYGKVSMIKINLKELNNTEFQLNQILVNTRVPFYFSLVRGIVFFFFWGATSLLVTTSKWLSLPFHQFAQQKKYFLLGGALLLLMLIFWYNIASHNKYYTSYNDMTDHYARLAEAFANHSFSIEELPSEELLALSNPYDRTLRDMSDIHYLWDYALYDGKYYVYYGVVPVFLFYLPYYLLFHAHILTYRVVFICLFFILSGLYLLFWKLSANQNSAMPLPIFYLLICLMANVIGAGVTYSPDMYSVPILLSIAFILWGSLSIWKAWKMQGLRQYFFYFIGGLFFALTAGCRPQFLIFSFFLPPLIYQIWKENSKKTGKTMGVLISIAIPYCLVASGLMYYNHARFGSVFDFGANYNLTTNDMRHRIWSLDFLGDSIYYYLFRNVNLQTAFPYLQRNTMEYAYNGFIIQEKTFGGLFRLCPLFFLVLLPVVYKRYYDNKKIRTFHISLLVMGLIVLILDTEMAGLLYRYTLDLDLFLIIPLILTMIQLYSHFQKMDTKIGVYATQFILVLIYIGLGIHFLMPFVADNYLDGEMIGNIYQILHIL